LPASDVVERNVELALQAALGVPIRLAVTDEIEKGRIHRLGPRRAVNRG
jgi:hypothetical protein